MELKQFDGMKKEELSMIEVAHAILDEKGDVLEFSELVTAIQKYLGITVGKMKKNTPQFYTDLNIDGSFISLGENRWGLRSWFPIDSIDEEVSHSNEEEDEVPRRKKRKKVSAFVPNTDDDDDVIDYNDDDPEDEDVVLVDEEGVVIDDEEESENDLVAYKSDLTEIGADEDEEDELPDGIEGSLTLIEEDDEDEDEFADEEEDKI
ncbi:DNA-directed RNA polymerase subunit delta [Carnobacterium maltaromaticum]|uniref:DNA-directed RNA polymerase subunit delta n=1 Tax=Carnobacterium maltaromaticum TaxID=2751 RepID=UPI0012FA54C4|nr:DNA-directed RNA polymerase subunit delta [Carnobacterium maltaromaticum]